MEKKELMKITLNGIVSMGIGSIVGDIAGYFLPKKMKPFVKVASGLATYIITDLASNKVSDYIESEIDGPDDELEETEEGP